MSRFCRSTPKPRFRTASRATITRSRTKIACPRMRRNRTFRHKGGRARFAAAATAAGGRPTELPEGDRVLDPALGPQGVDASLVAERRQVALEDLAVVPHRLQDVLHERRV